MTWRWALVWLAACGSETPRARDAFVPDAKPVAIESLLRSSVVTNGLWFADRQCKQYSADGEVRDGLHELARCLATLHLTIDPRANPIASKTQLVSSTGLELEAELTYDDGRPRLQSIGSSSSPRVTVTPATLESLRTAGDPDGPLAAEIAAQLDAARNGETEFAWLRVCPGDPARAIEASSLVAARAFEAAASAWQFRMFAPSICAFVRMAYPPARHDHDIRPLIGSDRVRLASLARGLRRRRGELHVIPSPKLREQMEQANIIRLRGAFELCFDETGHVTDVQPLRSTGFADYDAAVMREISTWEYEPYIDDDRAAPACTSVTFTTNHANEPLCEATGRQGCL